VSSFILLAQQLLEYVLVVCENLDLHCSKRCRDDAMKLLRPVSHTIVHDTLATANGDEVVMHFHSIILHAYPLCV
jgi:hypothetical protein